MTPEEEAISKEQEAAGNEQVEENPILGRFKTEEEANEYIASLESKKEEEEKEELLNFNREIEEEEEEEILSTDEERNLDEIVQRKVNKQVDQRMSKLSSSFQKQQDRADADVIAQYPNYGNYTKAAYAEVKKNPGISLLDAFESVYDTLGEMKAARDQKVATAADDAKLIEKKKMAQVERSNTAGGEEMASGSESDALKKALNYDMSPGDENRGRKV